jgi:hypothetical protein
VLHISLLTLQILLLTVSFYLYPRKLTFSTLKLYMYMHPAPNNFRDRAVSLYSSKIVDTRYYVLFLIPVFSSQVTKLVQFTLYNTFSKIPPSTSMHFPACVRTWRVARLYSVQYSTV